MSSILKALKKIEGREVDTRPPIWPYGTGNLQAASTHVRRSRQRQKLLWFLIILCMIALAGKIYIGSRTKPEALAPENAPYRKILPSETDLSKSTAETAEPVTEPAATPAPPLDIPPAPAPASVTDSPEATAPEPVAPADSPTTPDPSPQTEAPETETVETAAPVIAPEVFGPSPSDNAGLSLMALVWSEVPASRFLVINGFIVREGGSIDGNTVVRIEEDYAVIRTNGAKWKLK